jgi:hypothetical protein
VVLNGFHGGAQLACSNFNRTLALGLAMIQKNSQGELRAVGHSSALSLCLKRVLCQESSVSYVSMMVVVED